jgi:hypothetical protein
VTGYTSSAAYTLCISHTDPVNTQGFQQSQRAVFSKSMFTHVAAIRSIFKIVTLFKVVSPSHRGFLTGLSPGLLAVAGCASPFQRSRTRIGEIVLLNMDDKGHTVQIQVQSSGETLYTTSKEMPPQNEEQPIITPEDGLPTGLRKYTVSATLDGGKDSIARTYPTKGGDCYSVTVRVGTDGRFRDMPSESEFEGCSQ